MSVNVEELTTVTGSNCTFMELKYVLLEVLSLRPAVLIVPLWN